MWVQQRCPYLDICKKHHTQNFFFLKHDDDSKLGDALWRLWKGEYEEGNLDSEDLDPRNKPVLPYYEYVPINVEYRCWWSSTRGARSARVLSSCLPGKRDAAPIHSWGNVPRTLLQLLCSWYHKQTRVLVQGNRIDPPPPTINNIASLAYS